MAGAEQRRGDARAGYKGNDMMKETSFGFSTSLSGFITLALSSRPGGAANGLAHPFHFCRGNVMADGPVS